MSNNNRRNLTDDENKAYRAMKKIAHNSVGQLYTTADLLKQVNHNLNGDSQKFIGTKFAYYASYQKNIEIKRGPSNNRYLTKY